MNALQRNNVHISGKGDVVIVFAHGLGADQNMWRFVAPGFEDRFKVVLFDLVGSGRSDLSAFDFDKYSHLQGYADDLLEIITGASEGPVIYVGHSVSATIGLLATIKAPELFHAQIMLGTSPCYLNVDGYTGGFERADLDDLCRTMDNNYVGWANTMAPVFMGASERPELASELATSFTRTDPDIARHFARTIFYGDYRAQLSQSSTPALILQSVDDFVVPRVVGEYMQQQMQFAQLQFVDNVGHFPHLSAPDACAAAINHFVNNLSFR